jgi:imidazole glycerol phosphate synthase subunit HisF
MFQQDKPKGYMHELDQWIEEAVLAPLWASWDRYASEHVPEAQARADADAAVAGIKKVIREKVLESYHNGQGARVPARKQKQYAAR